MPSKDPFRTLDDEDPKPAPESDLVAPAGQIFAGVAAPAAPGYWVLPALRPSWLRRFVVWVLLGWKWRP